MSSNFMPFLCPAAGESHRLPCGDCRAGSTFTPVFIYRSRVWTVTGSPAAGQRSAHTHKHTNTYALTSAFLYLSGSHFMIEDPLSSATRCNSFFFLYKKKTKVSIQILFKNNKSNSRFRKKKKTALLCTCVFCPSRTWTTLRWNSGSKKRKHSWLVPGGGETTVKWIILGCRRGQSELQHTCYSLFLTRTFEK